MGYNTISLQRHWLQFMNSMDGTPKHSLLHENCNSPVHFELWYKWSEWVCVSMRRGGGGCITCGFGRVRISVLADTLDRHHLANDLKKKYRMSGRKERWLRTNLGIYPHAASTKDDVMILKQSVLLTNRADDEGPTIVERSLQCMLNRFLIFLLHLLFAFSDLFVVFIQQLLLYRIGARLTWYYSSELMLPSCRKPSNKASSRNVIISLYSSPSNSSKRSNLLKPSTLILSIIV